MKEGLSLALVIVAITFLHTYQWMNRNSVKLTSAAENTFQPLRFISGDRLPEKSYVGQSFAAQESIVENVGVRLTNAINLYYATHGKRKQLDNYSWQYRLEPNPKINAYCLPGGHIVVNSGLLNVSQNSSALAFVMGHEIAHALFRTASFQGARALITERDAALVVPLFNCQGQRSFSGNVSGVTSSEDLQAEEIEADKYGLLFTALAGYDPGEALPFWHRMQSTLKPNLNPGILTNHPTEEVRLKELVAYLPTVLKYYQPK